MSCCTEAIFEESGHAHSGVGKFAHSFAFHTNSSSNTFLLLKIILVPVWFYNFLLYLRLLKADCSCRSHVLLLEYKRKVFPY
ncbi:hypothetical protein FKM82_010681 [Ascaphus truei]